MASWADGSAFLAWRVCLSVGRGVWGTPGMQHATATAAATAAAAAAFVSNLAGGKVCLLQLILQIWCLAYKLCKLLGQIL